MASATRSSAKTRAQASRPSAKQADKAAATEVSDRPSIRVRMYRQGLGDCLLFSILRPEGEPDFHMMIDCGVLLGTPAAGDRLKAVVADIIQETNGKIDVLAVTHEHYDHVAGFVLAQDSFALPGKPEKGKLSVGQVWFAWTEKPDDPLAKELREDRGRQVAALAAVANRLGSAANAACPELDAALAYFGAAAGSVGATRRGMEIAAGLAQGANLIYHDPGAIITPTGAPEIRIYVLGPPRDRAQLLKRDAAAEVYHLDDTRLAESVIAAYAPDDEAVGALTAPFDRAWATPLDPRPTIGPVAEFLNARYFGTPNGTPDVDPAWRRIDDAWLEGASEFALALDASTNNTSLVMAVEVVKTGQVLLFAADAQVGNWLSWHKLKWADAGLMADAATLLGKTIFYKVGHHGSHNATLRTQGLELMPKTGIVAFITVDQVMAQAKRWNRMPLPALVDALTERCGGPPIRVDQEVGPGSPVKSGGTWPNFTDKPSYGSLYHEWSLAL